MVSHGARRCAHSSVHRSENGGEDFGISVPRSDTDWGHQANGTGHQTECKQPTQLEHQDAVGGYLPTKLESVCGEAFALIEQNSVVIDAISVNNLQSLMRSFYTALVLLYQSVANKNGISEKFHTFVYYLVTCKRSGENDNKKQQ